MRAQVMLAGLSLALVMACGDSSADPKVARERDTSGAHDKAANPVALGTVGSRAEEAPDGGVVALEVVGLTTPSPIAELLGGLDALGYLTSLGLHDHARLGEQVVSL